MQVHFYNLKFISAISLTATVEHLNETPILKD